MRIEFCYFFKDFTQNFLEVTIGDIIGGAIKRSRNRTIGSVATKLGITRDVLSNMINGRTPIDEDVVKRIRAELGLPASWPYSELAQVGHQEIGIEDAPKGIRNLLSGKWVGLPLYNGAIAGSDDEFTFGEEVAEVAEFPLAFLGDVEEVVRNLDLYFLIRVSGFSMATRINQGDIVAVKRDPNPGIGSIVAAERPDRQRIIKVLVVQDTRPALRSINGDRNPPIMIDGHTLVGGVVCIYDPSSVSGRNVETRFGPYLKG